MKLTLADVSGPVTLFVPKRHGPARLYGYALYAHPYRGAPVLAPTRRGRASGNVLHLDCDPALMESLRAHVRAGGDLVRVQVDDGDGSVPALALVTGRVPVAARPLAGEWRGAR